MVWFIGSTHPISSDGQICSFWVRCWSDTHSNRRPVLSQTWRIKICFKHHFVFMISRISKNLLPNYQNPGLPVVGLNYHESFVVSHQVGVHTDDGGVCLSDPGEAVGSQLPDLAGQVDCLALPHGQVHHLGLTQPTEVRALVKPRVPPCDRNPVKLFT